MEVTRRPARETDMDFARSVHHQAYRDVSVRQFGPWDERQQDEYFAEDWTSGEFEIVLCDGIPSGYLCVEDGEHNIHIRELVLMPEFQGRGIGSSLLREVMQRASRRGVPVRLGTFHMNRALDLYRRLGFKEIGRTETQILMEWTHHDPESP
jgi:ribosomal protein S18 acetylase RimI-like enzyme